MTKAEPAWLRPTVDYGPLVAFFAVYLAAGLLPATVALMVVTAVGLGLSLAVTGRVPTMPLVTAAVVGVFGGLTVWLNDETFIKMKPTIVQALFAVVLLGGLAFGKVLLKPLFHTLWPIDDAGWRRLTIRFGLFFAAMAALNEIVWRTQSTDFWVSFKVFGILILTFAFAMAQVPLLNRHRLPDADADAPG
ncbi:MAG: septation protein A [Alphaproteobacteria bacterium]